MLVGKSFIVDPQRSLDIQNLLTLLHCEAPDVDGSI